jgi:hypothetical protein
MCIIAEKEDYNYNSRRQSPLAGHIASMGVSYCGGDLFIIFRFVVVGGGVVFGCY